MAPAFASLVSVAKFFKQPSIHPRHPSPEMVVCGGLGGDVFLHRPDQRLPVQHQVVDLSAVQRQGLVDHADACGRLCFGGGSVNQGIQRGVGKPAVVVFAFAGARLERMHQRVHGGLGIGFCPAPTHQVKGALQLLQPLKELRLGHRVDPYSHIHFGQHGRDGDAQGFVVHVAVVGAVQGGVKPVGVTSLGK